MSRLRSPRGFTLVEMLFVATLTGVITIGMLSTYLFLGRNLTRLSYRRALEIQSRTILNTLGNDVRKATAISNAASNGLTLTLTDGSTVVYSYSSSSLSRNAGSGAVALISDIKGEKTQVPVTMPTATFSYYTTTNGTPAAWMDIKRVDLSFTLQAGGSTQAASGTQSQFQTASARFLLRNRQLVNGY
ncbi:MAG TPA: prepilin-type N-terminal cleavage/methylation domain-containing protein [Candidatus Didemnitutus sp.]|nr:prepilin-type N-terminal cleavage/methylation domain-containing protein [Candidatus Didemnitutus sp.]